uniref:Peptidase S1 domain-containing protein n=1 Tax=Gopherus agassizii TaxID=38772 RepID=A0A452GWX0_9SAUR
MEWRAGGCARCIRAQPHPRCARLQVGPRPRCAPAPAVKGTWLQRNLLPAPSPGGRGAGAIIGGPEAQSHSRPYMAFVSRGIRRNRGSRCGGFLIREGVVVTAPLSRGHSAYPQWYVRGGSWTGERESNQSPPGCEEE